MLVGGIVVRNQMNGLVLGSLPIDESQELDPLLVTSFGMQVPITVPSSVFKAANKVVVPWRL
jgi:hypothetical protein